MSGWHLEYNIDVDPVNRIVYEKIFGVWRVSTAESYLQDFEEEVGPLVKVEKPWVRLCDLTNWKTSTPEVGDIIAKHLQWCKEHGIVWSANVINNPVTYSQLQKMFNKGGTKNISQTFRTREEAESFLIEKGFNVNKTFNGYKH